MKRTSRLLVCSMLIAVGAHVRSDAVQDQRAQSAPRHVQHVDEALLSKPSHRVRIENDQVYRY